VAQARLRAVDGLPLPDVTVRPAGGSGPRTITVRVRTLGVVAVVVLAINVRIPADGTRIVAFVFHANPRSACTPNVYSDPSVRVHFTALGLVHDTQRLQLGDMTTYMKGRTR